MKKLFIAVVAVIALGTSAFAADVNVHVDSKFKSQFGNVSDVKWTISTEYSKASFISNGERMEAYYDNSATLIATCKAVAIEKLPLRAQKKIQKSFAGYQLKECIGVDSAEDGITYYASLSNGSKNIILQIGQLGSVSFFKSEKN
ncbi:MAG: hypothetical protein JWN76_3672 [Chitinophagaceae bacterium]|nr:hypothetical protein [Chitinophagaceae bacterium]